MSIKNTPKIVGCGLLALSVLASAAAQALWVQQRPDTEIITQFHGDPENSQLRLFMAGNQFVVMDNLIAEFKKQYPKYKEIYYVTIPPGKELQWILQGGAEWKAADFPNVQELVKGDQDDPATWSMATTDELGVGFKMLQMPDVYTTVAGGHMTSLGDAGLIHEYFPYTHNQLAVMADESQLPFLQAIADDDTIITDSVDDGKPGIVDGKLTAEGLYRLFASAEVFISEPDIVTQGIERHIWRMYTNASHAVFGCPGSAHPVCTVGVNDVFLGAGQKDDYDGLMAFFTDEDDTSLRKIVYYLKRFNLPPYDALNDATTFITAVHHLETPAHIEEGVDMMPLRLTVGPVWGTEVQFQQNRKDNPDIVAIPVSDSPGPDGKALNRSDDVNYLAAEIDTSNEKNNRAARDFLDFLKSPEAQFILEQAGFIPATADELNNTTLLP